MVNSHMAGITLERMARAIEKVRNRLYRACEALATARVLYAVARENATAYWISTIDPSAVRNTPAVDIVIREENLSQAELALTSAGFVRCMTDERFLFLESIAAYARDGVEITPAGSNTAVSTGISALDVLGAESTSEFHVLSIDALTRQLLTSFRLCDRVCVRDLIDVRLLDATWCNRLPAELSTRLRSILDDPDG